MRKIESLFVGTAIMTTVLGVGISIWNYQARAPYDNGYKFAPTKYGAFLAAQHAVYVNDFDNAAKFMSNLADVDSATVSSVRYISQFLDGHMPADADLLRDEKSAPARIIYDAYLISGGDWGSVYKRHKTDENALIAPLRIWSAVASKHTKDALKFIDKLPTNDSWKSFVRGQIYAETGDIAQAAKSFAAVRPDFMNINDYMYIMSFYTHNNLNDAAEKLHTEFTSRPGGMYMLEFNDVPDWTQFAGYKNALAFSLVQNVSHTQVMMYSDLAMLLLRFAQVTGPAFDENNDAMNYYLGQFFFNNTGDYERFFAKIPQSSPFYLFAQMRMADADGNMHAVHRVVRANPLFVPAVNKLVGHYISTGNRRAALRTINTTLKNKNLTEQGRAFFLKNRAYINYVFGDLSDAQSDIKSAADVLPMDAEILSLQAKIWAAENREIDNAYDYAMALVRKNPTDIMAWDTLGVVVAVREGAPAAIELLARVGEISVTCSSLFLHLGDLYAETGDVARARDAYMRAIELADDGLIVVPDVNRKLRKLK